MSNLTTPKGTHDLLPEALETWHHVERLASQLLEQAGYGEIRTPVFEATELFARGVGESTDIVNKEMYTFEKSDRSLTLRPENTASVVRSYIQHGMDRWPKPVKLYYTGPMFRYERPQAGRQRQFHQLGVEVFGVDTPQADAEVMTLAMTLFETLGLKDLTLDVNNVGCFDCRDTFRTALRALVEPHLPQLCADCQKRFETNPLRMLDCKVSTCKAIYAQPQIEGFLQGDHTCEACQTHFNGLLTILDALQVPYRKNPMLVRGLDYYTRTVFEISSCHLGAQSAVCGGGRYNGLVKTLGGPETPAVGWALGMERLTSLIATQSKASLDYFVASDVPAEALKLCTQIRAQGYSAQCDLTGKALGKQFAQANKLQAQVVVVQGESERASGTLVLKTLATGDQVSVVNDGQAGFCASPAEALQRF